MTDAIIFAGGWGTRVKHLLPTGYPKFLADINGRPFCELQFDQLKQLDVDHIILVLGIYRDKIISHIEKPRDDGLTFSWCVAEGSPDFLCEAAKPATTLTSPYVWVVNGDTLINMIDWRHKPGFQSLYYGNTYAGWSQVPVTMIGIHPQRGTPMQCKAFIDIGTPEGLITLREKTK